MNIEQAQTALAEQLKKEGFGIVSTLDLQAKFRQKLGLDFHKYLIVGVCDPGSAHKVVQAEENIGLFLPCNMLLYERDGQVVLSVIRPSMTMRMVGNVALVPIAEDVEARLKKVFDSIH
jgi:uncharacterized protein (DUF302 family)